MRYLAGLANTPLAEAVGWALIHSLWQGVLAFIAVFAASRFTRSAQLRYVAGLLGMASTGVAFAATLFLCLPDQVNSAAPEPATITAAPILPASKPGKQGAFDFDAVVPYLTVLWLAGVLACQIRQAAGLVSIRHLRRKGTLQPPAAWTRELNRLAARMRLSQPVLLLESIRVDTPVVLGHFRPAILVPVGFLTGLPPSQVEALLLHELAHVLRRDYLVNLCQRWLEAIFFYHPAVWWMSRAVRIEREHRCDDLAAGMCGDGYKYATALAALEQHRDVSRAPALAARDGNLPSRIRRILHGNPPPAAGGVLTMLAMVAATAAFAVAGWQTTAPPPLPIQPPATASAAFPPYLKWLSEDVVYLITPEERAAFDRLATDDEREMFITQFWLRRDPNPATPVNEEKTEHYRRIAYANERFASGLAGWRTDRGRTYIVWGPPAEIESHPKQSGTTAYEMWRYRSTSGVQTPLVFVDAEGTGEYRLAGPSAAHPGYNRLVRWTVTDPLGRLVTGLQPGHFLIRENGLTRTLTHFSAPDNSTAVAVVSESSIPDLRSVPVSGELIQTRTVGDAIRQLNASSSTRKALVLALPHPGNTFPSGIQVVRADPSQVIPTVIAICNQYAGGFMSAAQDTPVEIEVNAQGLPPLRVNAAAP